MCDLQFNVFNDNISAPPLSKLDEIIVNDITCENYHVIRVSFNIMSLLQYILIIYILKIEFRSYGSRSWRKDRVWLKKKMIIFLHVYMQYPKIIEEFQFFELSVMCLLI